ncbi:helicase RepA family protein [Thioclava sp. F36-7]|uniref:helicase RepA family protein n=1 Tax=Thioclava sp. F36-7 TaxID=1915317 RepID=UPI0009973B9C|nr:helicase RepA family protein [Thioclava sp. F36-7]OOY07357.1 hypothetical protein BMI89_17955 [Thioclava sp. F36-7]
MRDTSNIGADDFERPPDGACAQEIAPTGGFALLTRKEAAAPRQSAPNLVDGWLRTGELSMLVAPSGSGKSFVALDLAHAIAAGTCWGSQKTRPGTVVYVAAEDPDGIRDRLRAIEVAKPEAAETVDVLRSLFTIEASVPLIEEGPVTNLIGAFEYADPDLVIFDTLARCLAGADENSSREMGSVIASLDRIRRETGAHVMLVHHTGKDATKGARGSSALRAAVDAEIAVTKDGDRITVSASKIRNGAAPAPLDFMLSPVDGAPSCVLRPVAHRAPRPALETTNEARTRKADERARALAPYLPQGTFSAIDAKAALAASGALTGSDDAIRKAAARSFDRMIELGLIVASGRDRFAQASDAGEA